MQIIPALQDWQRPDEISDIWYTINNKLKLLVILKCEPSQGINHQQAHNEGTEVQTPDSEQNVLVMFLALGKKRFPCAWRVRGSTFVKQCILNVFSTYLVHLVCRQRICLQCRRPEFNPLGWEDPWRRK